LHERNFHALISSVDGAKLYRDIVVEKLKALVVEDETALRIIYERILSKADYEVLQARDGQQAFDILRHHTPNLIFLDMLLPGVNGLDVLDYIATQPHIANHTHIVIASSSKEYEQYVGMVPSCQFVLKPILPTQIRDIATQLAETQHA
jgi:CheY-like chemotaxis protein